MLVFLVGRDDKFITFEGLTFPDALIQIEDSVGLDGECGVPGTTRAGALVQSGQSFFGEALSPHADNLATSVKASGDPIIRHALGSAKHHPGAHDLKIR
jgi:hypothetical protein